MAGMFWVEILLHSICYWGGSVTVDQFDIVSITVFVSSFKSKSTCIQCENPLIKLTAVVLAPYLENSAVLFFVWVMSLTLAPLVGIWFKKTPAFLLLLYILLV